MAQVQFSETTPYLILEPDEIVLLKDLMVTHLGEDDEPTLHRTSVEEMEGDVFDALALEMVNDQVEASARHRMGLHATFVHTLLRDAEEGKPLAILLEVEEAPHLMGVFNSLYSQMRVQDLEGFTIGEAQGDLEASPTSPALGLVMELLDILATLVTISQQVLWDMGNA